MSVSKPKSQNSKSKAYTQHEMRKVQKTSEMIEAKPAKTKQAIVETLENGEFLDLSKIQSINNNTNNNNNSKEVFYPKQFRERMAKMLASSSAAQHPAQQQVSHLPRKLPLPFNYHQKKHYLHMTERRSLIDEPTQATTEEKYLHIPRTTVLSRTRQQLCKRNSSMQSKEVIQRNVKLQTETRQKNACVTAEPMDFIGLFEKGTNFGSDGGNYLDKATQMYEHITQSDLFCIEWIHKNLFEVKLSPNTLVVDDKIRDVSETPCVV